jgi:phospholipase D1/2
MTSILETPGAVWCAKDVTAAGVLVDANDYFKAFYEAALTARRSILLSGWQFDSDVELLRGKDAEGAPMPVTLKAFLNALCEARPDLRIQILAWDFHMVFALEREWMQRLVFHWTTHERLHFRFDSSHVDKGCHHQKFAVIDGCVSFLGGLDLCDHRWDTPRHRDEDEMRMSRGEPHKPFHDIQTYLVGREVAASLEELFSCRWELAGGEPFELPPACDPSVDYEKKPPRGAHVLPAKRVGLSRTDPKGSPSESPESARECHEVNELYCAAIASADEHIYVETQYFSSAKVSEALVKRLSAPGRPAIDVVLVLNMRAETMKEQLAVGLAQAKVLSDLRKAAEGTPHRLGIYYTVPARSDGKEPERATYIHAKLMIVDDRLLNIGSANLTNRSASVDTELNASFEASSADDEMAKSIQRLRLRLVAEHLGIDGELSLDDARVASLDARAKSRDGRLRLHPSPTPRESKILDVIDPQALPFDPHGVEEDDDESRSVFARGIGALFRVFSNRDDRK